MTIGILTNTIKDPHFDKTNLLAQSLRERGVREVLQQSVYGCKSNAVSDQVQQFFKSCDILLVLGGDGTLLYAARHCAQYGTKLLGIDLGRLGFLAEAQMNDIPAVLDQLLAEDYRVEARSMLSVAIERADGSVAAGRIALNDAVLARGSYARIVQWRVMVDAHLMDQYIADGIIVSTPTGSTAYSLSSGGPIISPALACMLITPICSHTLRARPVAVSDRASICLYAESTMDALQLTIDGQEVYAIAPDECVHITRSAHATQFVRLREPDFFSQLRRKLMK